MVTLCVRLSLSPSTSSRCPYLHRTAGDTERRYHLRYYKTSTCVYETDARGYCVKNGPHCAFAHGPHDLRGPVYDIRELQGQQDDEDRLVSPLVGSLEREKGVLIDDTRWQGKVLYFRLVCYRCCFLCVCRNDKRATPLPGIQCLEAVYLLPADCSCMELFTEFKMHARHGSHVR